MVDGAHERDVGQVVAAGERVVEGEHVTGARIAGSHPAHRLRHGAEMHRDVLGLRDQAPVGVEQRRGAVPALFDVGGVGGPDEHLAHLLGDAGQRRGQHRQRHRVHGGAGLRGGRVAAGCGGGRPSGPLQDEGADLVDASRPAGAQHAGRLGELDDRRAGKPVPRGERGARDDVNLPPPVPDPDVAPAGTAGRIRGRAVQRGSLARDQRGYAQRDDLDRLAPRSGSRNVARARREPRRRASASVAPVPVRRRETP